MRDVQTHKQFRTVEVPHPTIAVSQDATPTVSRAVFHEQPTPPGGSVVRLPEEQLNTIFKQADMWWGVLDFTHLTIQKYCAEAGGFAWDGRQVRQPPLTFTYLLCLVCAHRCSCGPCLQPLIPAPTSTVGAAKAMGLHSTR